MKMYQIDFNKPIHIHFMGIGGIIMSGRAEILIKEGFTISGSDVHTSDIIKHLEDKGAKVDLSQTADNIKMCIRDSSCTFHDFLPVSFLKITSTDRL